MRSSGLVSAMGLAAALSRMGGPMIQSVFHPDHQKNRRGGYRVNHGHNPHQGASECARRLRQRETRRGPGANA